MESVFWTLCNRCSASFARRLILGDRSGSLAEWWPRDRRTNGITRFGTLVRDSPGNRSDTQSDSKQALRSDSLGELVREQKLNAVEKVGPLQGIQKAGDRLIVVGGPFE